MYGEVVCTERRGWKRVYDLAERAVPDALLHDDLDDAECLRRLVRLAGPALGVATRADLADYHRLKGEQVDAVVADSGLVPVEVEGWAKPAWADPAALAAPPRGRHRTTLLSPFDSLIWDRARTERIFGFTHRLEAYVPAPEAGARLFRHAAAGRRPAASAGSTRPARARTLVARQVSLRRRQGRRPDGPGAAEAATWVGCDARTRGAGRPPRTRPHLARASTASAAQATGSPIQRPLTGSRGSSPASRTPPPPSGSAAAASPGCCGRGSSRCSRR